MFNGELARISDRVAEDAISWPQGLLKVHK